MSPSVRARWVPVASDTTVGSSTAVAVEVTDVLLVQVAPASAEVHTSSPPELPCP
jgi:hypothetical protein